MDSATTKKSVGVSEEAPGVAESGVVNAAIESDKETVATAQSIQFVFSILDRTIKVSQSINDSDIGL